MYGDDNRKLQVEARGKLSIGLFGYVVGASLIIWAVEIRQLGGFVLCLLGLALLATSTIYVVRWWRSF